MDAEGLVRVECGAGCLRVFRDQFEIAERRDQSHDERDEERQATPPADLVRHLPRQGVDAGAEKCRRR